MLEIMVCQRPLIYPYFNVQFFGYLTTGCIYALTIYDFKYTLRPYIVGAALAAALGFGLGAICPQGRVEG